MKRVGIIFSGGPAPGANAVISAATRSFLDAGAEVVGFFHGYTNLQHYDAKSYPLVEEVHFRRLSEVDTRGLRNTRGVLIGTARVNPGAEIKSVEDLDDPSKTVRLRNIYRGLRSLEVDALISIGGDDTLKTANYLRCYQQRHGDEGSKIAIVHVPKTIDNDYRGIDFTFGFFTAVDVMSRELQNLRADCMATSSYFIVETMGRKAGWLSYGVSIAGEANLVISTEDVKDELAFEHREYDPVLGQEISQTRLSLDALVERIVELIVARENRGEHYGTVVLAEGLAEMLPDEVLRGLPRDDHGHIWLSGFDLAKVVSQRVAAFYEERTGRTKKIRSMQLGYESRCAEPHAFDVMLGSQLGIGAYRALNEKGFDAHMVSVTGQLDLQYVPFDHLIDPKTLRTEVRYIDPKSDFYRLARFLETRTEGQRGWGPGFRSEPPPAK